MTAEVLVIGAGPYGFAAAGELARRGVDAVIVGTPFVTWREHTFDGTWLRSDCRASSIWSADDRWSLPRFLAAREVPAGAAVPVAVFRDYLREVAAAPPCPLLQASVRRLVAVGAGFRAELEGGEVVTVRAVVVATGMGAHRHLPEALVGLPSDHLFHSWDAGAIQGLAGRRVLVVGGGQSAGEAVEALLARNRVTWAMRRPPLFCNPPLNAPTPVFEAILASWQLLLKLPPPLLRALSQRVFRTTVTVRLRAVYADPRVRTVLADAAALGLTNGGGALRAADGSEYDAVVAATGYRPRLAGFDFLAPELARALGEPDAAPPVDASFESRVPGLLFLGGVSEAVHGPAMRFIAGSRHAALRAARRVEERLGRRAIR